MLRAIPTGTVRLVLTSPPFALTRQKAYGNEPSGSYVAWLKPFVAEIHRVLMDDGSFVLDLGGSWKSGRPVRNVYQYEVLLSILRDRTHRFMLAQDFFWLNRARLPGPIQWVNIERIRVTDAVNVVWWFSKSDRPFADNRAVLRPYSDSMLKLFDHGYNSGRRPSEWVIGKRSFDTNNGGSIPKNYLGLDDEQYGYPTNLLAGSNTSSRDPYLLACTNLGLPTHPARFPVQFAEFFIDFLSKPGDLVVDPFAGSNTVGWAAQRKGRRWAAVDLEWRYLVPSAARFGLDPKSAARRFASSAKLRPSV